jgi:cold shock CspA family protein
MIYEGTVVYFKPTNSFGFVRNDSGEWFFHIANSPDFTPALGLRVQFELAAPLRLGQRDMAVNLRVVEGAL